ncbi:hypothetical protein LTI14_03325 [Nesterenkonia sp. YGD6]|nr:hypothetical protein [Nesterenkonia sp. YGD6]
MTPFALLGCAAEEEPSSPTQPSSESAPPVEESEEPQQTSTPEPEEQPDTSPDDGDSGEIPQGEGPGGDLPDPDEIDIERTEELGAYFSEEEACMFIGSMMEGLQTDMNEGVEDQEVLDEIYSAVEQNYILVPVELREPLENILALVDTDVESLDEEAVLVAAEPVDGWFTVEFCEGEYHNQTSGGDA